MDTILIKIAVRRFLEFMLTCIIVSVLITFLNVAEVLTTDITLGIGLLTGFILYTVENIRMLRGCYRGLENDMEYVIVNISAYLLYAAVTFAFYLLASNECYVWLFLVTKFVRFIGLDVETHIAMLLFHSIGFLTIFFAPIGMSWTTNDTDPGVGFMEEE